MSRGSKPVEESPKFETPFGHVRDRIIIHPNPKVPKEGVFISLNGYPFQVKPGVEIDIPRPVRLMLDTLIETETNYGDDGKQYTRDIPRITYTIVKEGINLNVEGEVIDGVEQKAAGQ